MHLFLLIPFQFFSNLDQPKQEKTQQHRATRQATSLGQVTFAPLQELELQVAFRLVLGGGFSPEKVDIGSLSHYL